MSLTVLGSMERGDIHLCVCVHELHTDQVGTVHIHANQWMIVTKELTTHCVHVIVHRYMYIDLYLYRCT